MKVKRIKYPTLYQALVALVHAKAMNLPKAKRSTFLNAADYWLTKRKSEFDGIFAKTTERLSGSGSYCYRIEVLNTKQNRNYACQFDIKNPLLHSCTFMFDWEVGKGNEDSRAHINIIPIYENS